MALALGVGVGGLHDTGGRQHGCAKSVPECTVFIFSSVICGEKSFLFSFIMNLAEDSSSALAVSRERPGGPQGTFVCANY